MGIRLVCAIALIHAGCVASTYRIPDGELARLAQTDPAARGASVTVRQELATEDEPPAARPVTADTQVIIVAPIHVNISGGGGSRGGVRGGGGSPIKGGVPDGKAGDAKDTAIAIAVIAAAGLVILAVTEGQRFSGRVQLHPMHPVHLFLRDGNYAIVPLAHIDPGLAASTERAVVRANEGPWYELSREPLNRQGWSYSMLGGIASSVSADGRLGVGPAFHVQIGYFPTTMIGVLGDLQFGWRDNRVGATLFDTRSSLEVQAWPLAVGRIHGGLFGDIGLAQRFEDGLPNGDKGDLALSGGAQLQFDLTTYLGLTARFGVTRAHDDFTREVMLGLAVY